MDDVVVRVPVCDDLGDLATHPLVAAFWQFHQANPHVYELFKDLAYKTLRAGHTRYSARSLFHVLRWHYALKTVGEGFKLNNNHTPFYARLLMTREKELSDFFEIRRAIADGVDMNGVTA